MRIEHDSMGEVEVSDDARWGAQTQRALDNFPISGEPLDRELIGALAAIKGASATVNGRLGVIDKAMAKAIHDAAVEVSRGDHDEQFPIDVFQTGSGTSSNMNMNEVLASLASERLGSQGSVHPNDHVNASQSSNDVFPSAIHLAAVHMTTMDLLPALDRLVAALRKKSREFATVVKSGRTHLMDATPVTLGQEFGGYAAQVREARDRIEAALPSVGVLPLGGTAVGTGINAPKTFARSVIKRLGDDMGLPLTEAKDHFAAQGARDALIGLSGDLRVLTVALIKIANDIRWMGSGPRAGLAEIRIPDLQPGSSIMPGKVNPVVCEAVTQVCAQVIGNDAAVAFAGSQGNFELNVYLPVIARNLLESIRLLASVSSLFASRCVSGIEANVDRLKQYAESSPSIGTALNPYIGYEKTAELVKKSTSTGQSIRELVLAEGLMTDEELDRALDVLSMTKGGLPDT
ncbi:MAG TPA: class II fumarate hydratase [Acidimicrobiales bacterium]|jgi:fumarate hydratase class II|nr:class II fumarate hydratase [Acidimicrobiales bacterium]